MKSKVKMHLIEQNVFVLAHSPKRVCKKDFLQDKYVSQDEVTEQDGVRVKRTEQDYPYTPETLNSYADGTNYRNDLNAAVSASAPGRNVGDISAIQELLTKSPEEIAAFFTSAVEKIKANSVAKDQDKPKSVAKGQDKPKEDKVDG